MGDRSEKELIQAFADKIAELADVRFGSMLLKKDFEGGLQAILIQDQHQTRKIDSKYRPR